MQAENTTPLENSLRLERLEIFGFKSFPEKTVFTFEPGITAIVGPNGCGKTNVMDSIRWVLGEQSANSMRGSRMEEVIFNGTEKMKPLGMGEVSITFKNENGYLPIDYSEVSITRRIFRSGESEYLINKNSCRLKDVQELFMDTGVGTKAYSFIEQGKVDMILSSRPEDRRFLFEEAAGIGKYKARKKEAERKLDSTEQNLVRLSDITAEVKRQINSLKRQVARARRYSTLSDELKELETLSAANEYSVLAESLSDYFKRFEEASSLSSKITEEISARENDLREWRKRLEEKERSADLISSKVNKISEETADLNNQIMLHKERIGALQIRTESAEKEKAGLREKLESYQDELKGYDEATLKLREDILQNEKDLKAGHEKLDQIAAERKTLSEKIEAAKEKVVDAASTESRMRSEMADLQAVLKNLQMRETRLKGEREELNARSGACAAAFQKASSDYEALKKESDRKKDAIAILEDEISNLAGNLQETREKAASLRERHNSGSSTLALMEEMKLNYEGYGPGVKAVLKDKRNDAGGFLPVADMVEAPSEFRPAIESALQESAQYIVVRSLQEAEDASNFLKEKNAGRAGFLVLDLASKERRGDLPPGILEEPGILGRASDRACLRSEFKGLEDLLLGGTVIAGDREAAKRVFRRLPEGWKVVTLEGEVFDPRGFISGGSAFSKQLGLVGREHFISELRESVRALASGLSSAEQEESALSADLDERSENRKILQKEFEELSKKLIHVESDYYRLKMEADKLREDIAVLDNEIDSVGRERASAREEVIEAEKMLESSLEQKSSVDSEMFSLQSDLENSARERERTLSDLADLRVAAARLKEKEESSRSHFLFKQQSHAECQEDLLRRDKEIEENSRLISEYSGKIERFSKDMEILTSDREEHSAIKLRVESECRELSEKIGKIDEELSGGRKQFNDTQDRAHRMEMKNSEIRMQMGSLEDRMMSRHRVDIKTIVKEKDFEGVDFENLNDEIARLQAKLDAMGPVNLIAIEEHKELEERYEFLTSQSEDLVMARETLQKAISRINQTARTMFLESFKVINKSFGEIFTELFRGGRAELILVDEKNVLESGIEIIARPPGKKLQSISLLSGGEKSMTAIALLFAILKNKPSPFCVLDEIDAALDDANIGRFVDIVKGFSESTQFLIVTHNKSTIAAASMIYGITMEEEGVSKPISIRFSERADSEGVIDEIEKFTGDEPSGAV